MPLNPLKKILDVTLPPKSHSYKILIEPGSLNQLEKVLQDYITPGFGKILMITDTHVSSFLGQPLLAQLKSAGFETYLYTIPEGEGSKSLATAENIFSFALDIGLSRKDVMIALGGGVVGDLTGFCAATYFRGVPYFQIPTTLLAQVDSSVGGKVAVNFSTAKNGIGAFYQPQAVIIDTDILAHLPLKQLQAGLGEVVKYCFIENTCTGTTGFFNFLNTAANASDSPSSDNHSFSLAHLMPKFPEIVETCCQIKAQVVIQDEKEESGIRSFLNLGHTFAHAYEEITQYKAFTHGEAVVLGIAKACQLSEQLGILPHSETQKFQSLCQSLGLGITPPETLAPTLEPLQLLRLMKKDKKASGGFIRFILPIHQIGEVTIRDDIPDEVLLSIL
jgi:3-dehydroquinate synthase